VQGCRVFLFSGFPLRTVILKTRAFVAFGQFAFTAVIVWALNGCATEERRDPSADVALRLGLGNALSFDTRGGPPNLPGPRPNELSLIDAVRQALSTDPDVQAALSRVRAAQADVEQAKLLPNPILSILFRFPERSGKPVIEADLGVELISILQRPGRMSAADHRLRAATGEAISTVLDAISQTQEHYAAVQALDAVMPVLEERRNLTARLLKLGQDRLNKGEGIRLDVTTLETQRLELEVAIRERRLERKEEQLILARLIGRPSSEPDWQVESWQPPQKISATESAWIVAAMEHRPEVETQRWELAALGMETRLARFSPFEPTEIGAKGERDNVWTVGPALSVPLPLFDWGQAKLAKAGALELEARHKFTKVQRQVIEEVRRAYASFVESLDTANLARDELVPAQERRRSETEAAYRAGQADVTTLILADQDLQTSREKLIDLERKASVSLFKLERSAGGARIAATLNSAATTLPSTRAVEPPATQADPNRHP
jgi:outer membrane protein TolC